MSTEPSHRERSGAPSRSLLGFLLVGAVLAAALTSASQAQTRVRFRTVRGNFDVELFDQQTPKTVANFLGLVNRGDYDNTFFHRSVPGFVLQGGGFKVGPPGDFNVSPVSSVPPVENEPGILNTRGTLAMAKIEGDPDSATTQWFINLTDNPQLDTQNGGFTVFGRVLGSGMSVVDVLAGLTVVEVNEQFQEVPLVSFTGITVQNEDLAKVESVDVVPGNDADPVPAAGSRVRFQTSLGSFEVELFDEETPLTVANFLALVGRGDYDNSIIHRLVPGFILQGGGYLATLPDPLGLVPSVDPVPNEPKFFNLRGTLAMAKIPGDPDSATTQWFINLADNRAQLEEQNGGFTVFGRVVGSGINVVDSIAALPVCGSGCQGFESLPLVNPGVGSLENDDLVVVQRISLVEDDDPGPGPGPEVPTLYFPVLPQGMGGFNGVAISNTSSAQAQLTLELIPKEPPGNGSGEGFSTEETLVVEPGAQLGRLVGQIFGEEAPSTAWIRMVGQEGILPAFFQFGRNDFSQLDGGVPVRDKSTRFYFSRVLEGEAVFRGETLTTSFSILNPNPAAVDLRIKFVPAQGGDPNVVFRKLGANSMLYISAGELFQQTPLAGYVEVKVTGEGEGVVGFEILESQDHSTVLGLNASTGNEGGQAFSAQLSIQEDLFTEINLINTAVEVRSVSVTAVSEEGGALTDPVQISLDAGGQFVQDARLMFAAGLGEGESFTGSLRVEADGPGVIGDIIFGDSSAFGYAASLPLQTLQFSEAVFSQVANLETFFTGIALFNSGVLDAEFTIQVFSPEGQLIGETQELLAAGARVSRLVHEYVEESAGRVGGYVVVRSDQPLIGQMLFGTLGPGGITLLSAVPPTVVQ